MFESLIAITRKKAMREKATYTTNTIFGKSYKNRWYPLLGARSTIIVIIIASIHGN